VGDRAQRIQLVGSLLVAVAIVAIAIAIVTANLGPTSAAELDAREERLEQRLDLREEQAKQRREAREDRLERSGRGGG
jgi:hypothetical protein